MGKIYSAVARFNSIKDEVLFVTNEYKLLEKWVDRANNIIKQYYKHFDSDETPLNDKSFSYKVFYLYEIDRIDIQETEIKVLKPKQLKNKECSRGLLKSNCSVSLYTSSSCGGCYYYKPTKSLFDKLVEKCDVKALTEEEIIASRMNAYKPYNLK